MIAKSTLTLDIPEITLSDLPENIQNLMEEFRLEHLPVVEGRKFMGMISSEALETHGMQRQRMVLGQFELLDIHVKPEQHIFEALRVMAAHSLSLLPVVNDQEDYMGSITRVDLIQKLTEGLGVNQPGGIIVLDIHTRDYSLQEIAGVVEGNNAKVLNLQVTPVPNSTQLYVTLKVNRPDINGILQTFNRYGYAVQASFQEESYADDFQLRMEELMRYINL